MPDVIYPDARGSGHVGVVISHLGEQFAYRTHRPDWFAGWAGICEYALAGVLLVALCAIELEPGAPLLVFRDNRGGTGTSQRDAPKKKMGRAVAPTIWRAAAVSACSIWLEGVANGLNFSDAPSPKCTLLG